MPSSPRSNLWRQALAHPGLWRRACWMACTVGCVQVLINQGDYWYRLAVDGGVVAKTILTPLVTFAVALASGACADVEKRPSTPVSTLDGPVVD